MGCTLVSINLNALSSKETCKDSIKGTLFNWIILTLILTLNLINHIMHENFQVDFLTHSANKQNDNSK